LNYDKEYKDSSTVNDRPVLHQLFVTVSPKLCQAVKNQVVRMKRYVTSTSSYYKLFYLVK
jgi:hypothetical protein